MIDAAGDATRLCEDGLYRLHATAIVLGSCGVLVTGPSGAGKSSLALGLCEEARRTGRFARLIADDQVVVQGLGPGRFAASPPETIAGLVEVRGSGLLRVPHLAQAMLHIAVAPGSLHGADRIPPDEEWLTIDGSGGLPLIRIPYAAPPAALAVLGMICALNR